MPSLSFQKLLQLQDVSGVAPLVQETEEAEVTRGDANGEEIQAAPKDSGKETVN